MLITYMGDLYRNYRKANGLMLVLKTSCPKSPVLCQHEIDSVLGESPDVSYDDRHQMPFFMATIHEIQRLANIAPLGVFHATTRNTTLMGYHIPQVSHSSQVSHTAQVKGFDLRHHTCDFLSSGRWKFQGRAVDVSALV